MRNNLQSWTYPGRNWGKIRILEATKKGKKSEKNIFIYLCPSKKTIQDTCMSTIFYKFNKIEKVTLLLVPLFSIITALIKKIKLLYVQNT